MKLMVALYRALLGLYPRSFRDDLENALARDFRSGMEAHPGGAARTTYCVRQVLDLLRNLPGAWADDRARCRRAANGRSTKGGWDMDGIAQDLKLALRSLAKRQGFSALVIATLGLGIGANAAVFAVVDGVLLEPLPYPDADRLVYMYESYRTDQTRSVSYLNYQDWRGRSRSFTDVGARTFWSFTLTGDGRAESLGAVILSSNLLPLLGVEPLHGRFFTEGEELTEERVLMLGEGAWARLFASDPGVVGRAITLDDEPWTVVGVVPGDVEFPVQADLYAPLTVLTESDRASRGSRPGIAVVGRMRPGVSLEGARADMEAVASGLEAEYPDANAEAGVVVRDLRERYLGSATPVLTPLLSAVALVFLIACANVANLLLVRGQARRREAAVRTALGGRRARVARTYLAEAGLLAIAGGVLGVAIASGAVGVLRDLSATGVPRLSRAEVDATVLLFTLGASALATLFVGVLPALRLSSVSPASALAEGGTRGGTSAGRGLRAALVVGEVGLSFVLLVALGLMVRSMTNLVGRDPGFDTAGVLTLGVPIPLAAYPTVADRARFFDELVTRVGALPGVQAVAGADPLPLGNNNRQMTFVSEGPSAVGEDGLRTDWYSVTPDYFTTMRIPIVEGRAFEAREVAEQPVVVVDVSFAERFWPGESAIGRRVRYVGAEGTAFTIVGVAEHVRHYGPRTEGREQIYVPHAQRMWGQNLLVRSQREAADLASQIRTVLTELDASIAMGAVATMEGLADGAVAAERLATRALAVFGVAALVLAMLGLYGVVSYTVGMRRREIGIRMALGAPGTDVARRVAREGLGLAGLGVVIGLLGALGATRLLAALLYGVEPADPVTLVAVAVGLLAVSALATALPATRASRVDPAGTLQAE